MSGRIIGETVACEYSAGKQTTEWPRWTNIDFDGCFDTLSLLIGITFVTYRSISLSYSHPFKINAIFALYRQYNNAFAYRVGASAFRFSTRARYAANETNLTMNYYR